MVPSAAVMLDPLSEPLINLCLWNGRAPNCAEPEKLGDGGDVVHGGRLISDGVDGVYAFVSSASPSRGCSA